MTYVVIENCIACKYTDCVEVCPVDCFYEGENTLVIHPDECIDCGVCEPECPADAIRPDTEPDILAKSTSTSRRNQQRRCLTYVGKSVAGPISKNNLTAASGTKRKFLATGQLSS